MLFAKVPIKFPKPPIKFPKAPRKFPKDPRKFPGAPSWSANPPKGPNRHRYSKRHKKILKKIPKKIPKIPINLPSQNLIRPNAFDSRVTDRTSGVGEPRSLARFVKNVFFVKSLPRRTISFVDIFSPSGDIRVLSPPY